MNSRVHYIITRRTLGHKKCVKNNNEIHEKISELECSELLAPDRRTDGLTNEPMDLRTDGQTPS